MPRDSMSTGDIIYAFPFSDAKLMKRDAQKISKLLVRPFLLS